MDDKINLQEIINYCKENGFIFLFISPFLLLLSIDLLSLQDLQQDSLLSILFACGSFFTTAFRINVIYINTCIEY